jgi:hypothetical protein
VRRWHPFALMALVLAAGCGGGGGDDDAPAATLDKSTTTTGDGAPPSIPETVPEEIDAAYLDDVMANLDVQLQDLTRVAVDDPSLGEEFQARIRALHTPGDIDEQIATYRPPPDGIALAADPGRPTTEVREIISASPACVFFSAERDLSPLLADPDDPVYAPVQPYYVKLVTHTPTDFNPTPWIIDQDTFYTDGSTPPDLCAGV